MLYATVLPAYFQRLIKSYIVGDMTYQRAVIGVIIICGLLLLALCGCTLNASSRWSKAGQEVSVSVLPLDRDLQDNNSNKVGQLNIIGGVELSSPDGRFGGFSGMAISPDGGKLWAISDRGNVLSARMQLNADGLPVKLYGARLEPLLNPDGTFVKGKAQSDSEELVIAPDGSMVVAFERRHRLLVYPQFKEPLSQTPTRLDLPPWLTDQRANRGVEAMTYLADGGLFVVAEGGGERWTPKIGQSCKVVCTTTMEGPRI